MGHTALVLGDQLSHANPALDGADRVLLVESRAALARLRYHRRRRHLVLSAMRHFAAEQRERGAEVVLERADTMAEVLARHDDVVCAAPNDGPARRSLSRAGVRFVDSTQFLTAPEAFADWAHGRRRFLMEDFYREQRRRFGVLMDGDEPAGGRWTSTPRIGSHRARACSRRGPTAARGRDRRGGPARPRRHGPRRVRRGRPARVAGHSRRGAARAEGLRDPPPTAPAPLR